MFFTLSIYTQVICHKIAVKYHHGLYRKTWTLKQKEGWNYLIFDYGQKCSLLVYINVYLMIYDLWFGWYVVLQYNSWDISTMFSTVIYKSIFLKSHSAYQHINISLCTKVHIRAHARTNKTFWLDSVYTCIRFFMITTQI